MPIPISNKEVVIVVLRPLIPPLPKLDRAPGRSTYIDISDPTLPSERLRRQDSTFLPAPPLIPPLPSAQ